MKSIEGHKPELSQPNQKIPLSLSEKAMFLYLALAISVIGGYPLYHHIFDLEPDKAMIEMTNFAATKSEAHQYAVKRLDECPRRFKANFKSCISKMVGDATVEKGGAYGDEVIRAISDVKIHFEEWDKAQSLKKS